MIELIILFCLLYFFLAWRRLDWAVMFIVAALPSYLIRFKILGIPFTLLEAMILIAFFVWLVKETKFLNALRGKYGWKDLKEGHKKRAPYPFGLELIFILIAAYISIFVAGLTDEALGIWKAYFFEPALFFILVLNVFKPHIDFLSTGFAKIIYSLSAGALAVSALAIYQKITGNLIDNPLWAAEATRRSVSFFGYPNAVGLYLGPIVMILLSYMFFLITNNQETRNKKISNNNNQNSNINNDKFGIWNLKSIFIISAIILSLLSIYFAKSIGAVIGLIVAGFIFGLLAGKKWRWATLIITGIVMIGVLATPSVLTKAINKITFQDLSGQIRLQQWRETWQMMTESPTRFIFGTGLSGYQRAIAPYHQEGIFFNSEHLPFEEFHRKTVFNEAYRMSHWQPVEIYMYPHNIILNFWTEMGVLGVILFIWVIGKYFWIIISNFEFRISNQNLISNVSKFEITNYLKLGLICAMIVLLVHGFVDVPYFKNDLSILFWLMVVMTCILNLQTKIIKK